MVVICECCQTQLPAWEPGSEPGNWGDWKCPKCWQPYCQDCGSMINWQTMQCIAYEQDVDVSYDTEDS